MLKADAQGFLLGEASDIGKKTLTAITDVRADVRAIKRAILGGKTSAPTTTATSISPSAATRMASAIAKKIATPKERTLAVARDAQGRYVKRETESDADRATVKPIASSAGKPNHPRGEKVGAGGTAKESITPTARNNAQERKTDAIATPTVRTHRKKVSSASEATTSGRDTKGRFTKRLGENDGTDTAENAIDESGFFGRLTNAVRDGVTDTSDVDPNIKAMQEVAEPMTRGAEVLFGGDKDKKKIGWLRKIHAMLGLQRKDDAKANKETNQTLKAIKDKPIEGGGRGILASILAAIIAIPGVLMALLSKIPFFGKMLKGGIGAGGLFGGNAGAAGKGLKGFLRKIPILGALLGGLGMAADVYGSETDDTLTRRQKDENAGKSVGGLAGMLGGAAAGATAGAALGPIGMFVGGLVGGFLGDQAGQIIGETVGGWVTDLREADIPGQIKTAWEDATKSIKSAWDSTMKTAESLWGDMRRMAETAWGKTKQTAAEIGEKAVKVANNANAAVKEKTGVDVKENLKTSAKMVKDGATIVAKVGADATDAAKAGAQWVGENTTPGRVAVSAWKGAKNTLNHWMDAKPYLADAAKTAQVDPGVLAKIGRIESGFNANAMPIQGGKKMSSAHGYGQFLDATWGDTIRKHGEKYGIQNAAKLTNKQAEAYRNDKTIQAGMLAEFTRENIEKGRKYGGADDDANVYAFHNLGDGDATRLLKGMNRNPSMSVREALSADIDRSKNPDKERKRIDKVIANNPLFYGDGTATVETAYRKMGQHMRKGEFFAQDIRSTSAPASAQLPSVTTSLPPATLPNKTASLMPTLTALTAAPKIPEPVGQSKGPLHVQVANANDVKQDVGDRHLAHVVTGGMARL